MDVVRSGSGGEGGVVCSSQDALPEEETDGELNNLAVMTLDQLKLAMGLGDATFSSSSSSSSSSSIASLSQTSPPFSSL
jgi:hypothetical protein